MDKLVQGTEYKFKENRTGNESDICLFSYRKEGNALVFFFRVRDQKIVSPYQEDNEDIWKGDVVEVFISPDGNLRRYYELEVTPYGVRFFGEIKNETLKEPRLTKLPPPFVANVELAQDGYEAKITLPVSALPDFCFEKCKLNAFCVDTNPDGTQNLYALNPTFCDSFHRSKYFVSCEKS